MASHKKYPTFIRIISNSKQVVCINPLLYSSFQIIEKAKLKVSGPKDSTDEKDYVYADTIKFFLPEGTGLSYSVGIHITQEEFNYICATMLEFLYLNEAEFKARSKALAEAQMDEFKRLSAENEKALDEKPV